jgi:hypothetical protein
MFLYACQQRSKLYSKQFIELARNMHQVSSWQGCYWPTLKLRNRPQFGRCTFLDTPHFLMQWLQKQTAAKHVVIFMHVVMKHTWRACLTSKPAMTKFILCIPRISYPNHMPCPSFNFTAVQIPSVVNETQCFSLRNTTNCSFHLRSKYLEQDNSNPKRLSYFCMDILQLPETNFVPHNGTENMSVT